MNNYKYDALVFIGRFQPFHIGHEQVIRTALSLAENVIILIGSANQPRTIKNPWTYMERVGMIADGLNLSRSDSGRVTYAPLSDAAYNDQKWVACVQSTVESIVHVKQAIKGSLNIGIIGHAKDSSSYYLKMFPQWKMVEHEMNEAISATDLRGLMFEGKNIRFIQSLLPAKTFDCVRAWRSTPEFNLLLEEYEHIEKYKRAWKAAPYAPTFVTTDAVVVQSGHVLLIQRRAAPGKGLYALPGGFLNQEEYLVDGMLRELREETKLKVPAPVLKGSIVNTRVFDKPDRSLRGRTITHAFLIQLPPGELPQVKGSDDAAKAMWVPISDIKEDQMFEDHYAIIQHMLGSV